jgi:CRP-like cAMP-binding protein
VFGEMSFFDEAVHSASVRTLSEVEVMRLSRSRFDELTAVCPSAARKIAACTASILADRLRQMDDWVCRLVERPDGAGHREEWQEFRKKLYSEWDF